MKIDDSSAANQNYASGIQKLLINDTSLSKLENTLGSFDLSFLEMLTSLSDTRKQEALRSYTLADKSSASSSKVISAKVLSFLEKAASQVESEEPTEEVVDDIDYVSLNDSVDADMILLKEAMTPIDFQYLKQVVIPGLPILLGTVPVQSVFPVEKNGSISYQGFGVSEQLDALIQQGYKTGRPIRVELNDKTSLVLKIKNGQVSAEFVSSDRAASMAMQQQLDELRNRMSAKNLPVGTLDAKYKENHQSGKKNSSNAQSE